MKSIEENAFWNCYNLKKVTLNEGLESIGEQAFNSCYMLEDINIPQNIKRIERGTFAHTSIRKLVLPESVEYVAHNAFYYIPNKQTDKEEKIYVYNGKTWPWEDEQTIIIPKYEGEVSITILNPECEFTISSFSGDIDKVYGYWNSTASEMYGERYDIFVSIGEYNKKKKEYLAGDANCDGTVDLADAVIIMQSLANPDKYGLDGTDERHITEQGIENGDVDKNIAGLTSNDALRIQEFLLGKAVEFE